MKRFVQLYLELDESNRTKEKVAALERYFRGAPPQDAAWALALFTGKRPGRPVNTTRLRQWVAEASNLPEWMVDECYDSVGDLSETISLLLPERDEPVLPSLHQVIEERVLALKKMDEVEKKHLVLKTWEEFDQSSRFVWHKLMSGGFRVGVSRTLVSRALANVVGIDTAVMAHRLMGSWEPTEEDYRRITSRVETETDMAQPYPFYLAYPFEGDPATLGAPSDWQIEWKWDGIRAQVIHRNGEVLVWTRGEELVTDRYPEVELVGKTLPPGTVLDGEIVCWKNDKPLPFSHLQKRIGRKTVGKKTLENSPVIFMAYDLLEKDGIDKRQEPLKERRKMLEQVTSRMRGMPYRLSPIVEGDSWIELSKLREQSRERLVEGFMLKERNSPYRTGRTKGEWWKWKVEPFTIDAVMIYAQKGHGRRASLYTDYTFGVWDGDQLVPVAKAYSGLTDKEIRRVDHWIKRNTTDRHGPVRVVKPALVFELAFEGIRASSRHKSGIAVRFPRMNRWREDKPPEEADTLDTMKSLLPTAEKDLID